jgi:hypothetical protein
MKNVYWTWYTVGVARVFQKSFDTFEEAAEHTKEYGDRIVGVAYGPADLAYNRFMPLIQFGERRTVNRSSSVCVHCKTTFDKHEPTTHKCLFGSTVFHTDDVISRSERV